MIIRNFHNHKKKETIIIELSKIVNPNSAANDNTGYIRIGTRLQGSQYYIDLNARAGVFEMQDPPGWCYLTSVLASNYHSRLKSDYFFNVTLYEKLPTRSKLGKILVVFPS